MVLAGLVIAVGVVVDDAIIDVENIVRRLRQTRREGSAESTAVDHPRGLARGAQRDRLRDPDQRRWPFVPVFFLQGLTGAFFRPLALSYALAVLASMVVALTVTPALRLILLSQGALERRESPLVRVLKRGYEAVAGAGHPPAARRRYATVVAVAAARASWSCPRLGPGAASRASRSATS